MPLTPKNRKEEWLQGLVDHETTLTPKNRPEEWMLGLIEGSTTLTPKNRCEEWLKEIIDASGGGGESSYTLLGTFELTVSTTSTSVITVDTLSVPGLYDVFSAKEKFIYVKIRDKAGERTDYFYGTDAFLLSNERMIFSYKNSGGAMNLSSNSYGVYPDTSVSPSSTITINARYHSTYSKTIDGTYSIEFYTLDFVDGISPFSM